MNNKPIHSTALIVFFSCVVFVHPHASADSSTPSTTDQTSSANSINWYLPSHKNWAFKNMDKVFATAVISKGKRIRTLQTKLKTLDNLAIEQEDGQRLAYRDHLSANQTDGLLVLHKGIIVAEEYLGNMQAESYHNWFSMAKSFTALTVGVLAAEGKIDLEQQTLHYMPELAGTAWEGTTVQMVMDMTVGLKFNEDYHDPESDLYQFGRAARFTEFENLPSKFDSVLDYLKTVKKEGEHDEVFHYVSLNTEVLGMIISKVSGRKPAELMSEKIWSKLGAQRDAYIVEDPTGLQLVSAAVNSTLRDVARFGQMVLQGGKYNGEQIIPKEFIEIIKKGGSAEKFAPSKRGQQFSGFSYTNQWWHTDDSALFAKGLFGQWLYIDPQREVVIAKFSTSVVPSPGWTNDLRLMRAISMQFD